MLRKIYGKWIALFLCALMAFTLCGAAAEDTPRLEDNYYQAVNANTLASMELAPGQLATGPMDGSIAAEISQLLINDFKEMSANGVDNDARYMESCMIYYELVKDMDKRDADGKEPIVWYVERIEAISSLDDLQAVAADLVLEGRSLPFKVDTTPDPEDSSATLLELNAPAIFLPGAELYADDNEAGGQRLAMLEAAIADILEIYGYSAREAGAMAADAMTFDKTIAAHMDSARERANTSGTGKAVLDDFAADIKNTDFVVLTEELAGFAPEEISLRNSGYFEAYDEIVTEDSLDVIKNWMIANLLLSGAQYLSTEFITPIQVMSGSTAAQAQNGEPAQLSEEALASAGYKTVEFSYGPLIGYYYATKYFSDEERETVTEMVDNILAEHRTRLEESDWLGQETIDGALKKLDAMTYIVGYPDEAPSYVDLTKEEGIDSAYECLTRITRESNRRKFGRLDEPFDKTDMTVMEWNLHATNAMYVPSLNSFIINAGILNAPFFDLNHSESANYGGIGMVIGHEIYHAFDSNGAQYDENGDMNFWWEEDDYAEFQRRVQSMVELFDGIPFADGAVDGELTVTENTADAGGISISLAVLKRQPGHDLEEFFESFAATWLTKRSPEAINNALLTDAHSPAEIRVNMQCSNCDDFYEIYDIKETDGMYLAPEDRVQIW